MNWQPIDPEQGIRDDIQNDKAVYIPEYMRMDHIFSGYRVGGNYHSCLRSIFEIHNETGNVWTMILTSICSTGLLLWSVCSFLPSISSTTVIDYLVFIVFWISCVIHLPFSVLNHLFVAISEEVAHKWKILDICFIYVAAWLLNITESYYTFSDELSWMYWFNIGTGAVICITFIYLTMFKTRQGIPTEKEKHTNRIGIASFTYIFPMFFHLIRGATIGIFDLGSLSAFGTPLSLALGAFLFVKRIPEVFAPGKYDIWGNSHQLMHFTLLIAHIFEYTFMLNGYHIKRIGIPIHISK